MSSESPESPEAPPPARKLVKRPPTTVKRPPSLVTGRVSVPVAASSEAYLRHKSATGTRASTVRTYSYDLRDAERFLGGRGLTSVDQIRTHDVEDYLIHLDQRGLSVSVRRNRSVVLKMMLQYAHKQGWVPSERCYDWKIIRAEAPPVYMPTYAEVRVIFAAVEDHWSPARNAPCRFRGARARLFFRRRDRAVIAVQVSVGLRPGETFSLFDVDYDPVRRCLIVRKSKNRRSRAVPVTDDLAEALDDYLAVRPAQSPTNYLFVTERGQQLSVSSWGHQFQRYIEFARKQGHDLPRITLYSLRHVAGTAVARESRREAVKLLGHTSERQLEERYDHVALEEIRKVHGKVDPLAGIFRKAARPTAPARPPRLV